MSFFAFANRFVPYYTWKQFGSIFDAVWGASAFKGAFGETLIVPDANLHLENNIAWLEVRYVFSYLYF